MKRLSLEQISKSGFKYIMIGLKALSLFFCSNPSTSKKIDGKANFESIEKYFADSIVIKLNDKIPNRTFLFKIIDRKCILCNYLYSKIYIYDLFKQQFEKTHVISKDTIETPNVLDFYLLDSIIYYTMENKEIVITKDDKIIKRKKIFTELSDAYIYANGMLIQDSNNIYFQFGLKSNHLNHNADYVILNSNLPNFGYISNDLMKDSILSLKYRIRESKVKQMVQSLIKYTIDSRKNIYFCFDMVDTIYKYNIPTNKLFKIYNISSLKFQPIFFNSDTCKDIEMTRYNIFAQSSNNVRLYYDTKRDILLRVIRYYHSELNKKQLYLQIIDNKSTLLKELEIPEQYSPFFIPINGEIYFEKQNKKDKRYVCKKINLDNFH